MDHQSNSSELGNYSVKDRKFYPSDFKEQVIAVYRSGIYPSVAKCAEAYGVNENTLHGWLAKNSKQTNPVAISEQVAELAQLRKELTRAKMENEILKKAAIYFANQAR